MPKTITLRINDKEYKTLAERAEAEKRSISNFIEMAALQYIKESEFADIEEMNDIMDDEGLLKRLKQGMNDAKSGKGRFVA
ncbi:MAG: CopG family transcriptional regulator [Deltaproteobacteria bacterium CG11_big_fil_rev_8_21_14_0_20_49_13]|nr:MAG: CopG family transcriptional regulator [Deltaproteobacteria bacterium CG11_big_fil_rev_8_21_14_0_20_49_13]